MKSTTSILSSSSRKISCMLLSCLTAIFTLQVFVLAMSISTAIAGDVELIDILPPNWQSPDSEILAKDVTSRLLPQLIGSDDQLRQRLGFSSLAQIEKLLLADPPFAVFRVGLNRLKNFNPPHLFSPLLEQENWFKFSPSSPKLRPVRFLFPIRESSRPPLGCTPPSLADIPAFGCIASSVQVKRLSGNWEFQQIGRPGLIKKLTQFGSGAIHFVIWIPVLNLHYLAKFGDSDLMIKAIAEDRHVKNPSTGNPFKAGEELSGNDVFGQLKLAVEVQNIDPNGPPG